MSAKPGEDHFTAIRYIGLAKAKAQVTLAAIAFNLRRWAVLDAV